MSSQTAVSRECEVTEMTNTYLAYNYNKQHIIFQHFVNRPLIPSTLPSHITNKYSILVQNGDKQRHKCLNWVSTKLDISIENLITGYK